MYKVIGPIALTLLAACSAAPGGGSTEPENTGDGTGSSTNSPSNGSGSSQSTGSSNSGSSTGNSGSTSSGHTGSSSGSSGSGTSGSTGTGSSSGSGTSGSGSADAGTKSTGSGGNANAPTWTEIYTKYLATGTIGHCESCHSQAASASGAYAFLSGNINGTHSTLSQIFSWMGGYMPPGGPTSNSQGTADVDAWIAAGALDN